MEGSILGGRVLLSMEDVEIDRICVKVLYVLMIRCICRSPCILLVHVYLTQLNLKLLSKQMILLKISHPTHLPTICIYDQINMDCSTL